MLDSDFLGKLKSVIFLPEMEHPVHPKKNKKLCPI